MDGNKSLDSLKITVLAEDSVSYESPYLGQHGISLLLEAEHNLLKQNILMDVGQNPQALLKNMELMGVPPAMIDIIVITHCHYDHTQGLAEILKSIGRDNIPVIAHPDIFRLNFVTDPMLRHVGVMMEDAREKLEEAGAILYLTRSPLQLLPGLSTTGEVPRKTDFEEVGIALQTIEDGLVKEDTMPDDISLAANIKNKGLFIITGCSHAGIVNITKHSQTLTGIEKIEGIVGGFHLVEASIERIKKTVDALAALKVRSIMAGHCTGFRAQAELYQTFKDNFQPLQTGNIFEI